MSFNVINTYQAFYDSTGKSRSAGFVTFYENTTTTLAQIFSDEALTVGQDNPYQLDAHGRITGDVKYSGLLTLKITNEDLSDVRTDDNVATTSSPANADLRFGPIFATVAAMTQVNPVDINGVAVTLVAGMSVTTQGYYAAGDGGGAIYLVVTPQSFDGYGDHGLANNNIAVLQYTGLIDVKQFGARGNGVSTEDDQPFILAALTVGSIDLGDSSSSYGFKNPIDLTISDREIVANGATLFYTEDWVHTRESTALEQLYMFNIGTDGGRPNTASSIAVSNVRMSGVFFDLTQPASISDGDTIYKSVAVEVGIGSSDVVIEECTFSRPRSFSPSRGSVFARTGTRNVTIDKCRAVNPDENAGEGGGGLVLSGTHSRVTNCYCENMFDAAIGLDDADHCIVDSNTIVLDAVDGGGSLIAVGTLCQLTFGASHNVVSNNSFKGIALNGITMYASVGLPAELIGNVITGNTFDGGGAVSNNPSYNIIMDEYCRNNIVDSNTFSNISNTSAGSSITRCYPRNNQITNNIVSDLDIDGNRTQQLMRGISIRFDDNPKETCTVTGNTISVGQAAIFFSSGDYLDTKRIIVENNTFIASTTDNANESLFAVDIDNTGTKYVRINDNAYAGTFGSDWNGTWAYIGWFQTPYFSHRHPLTKIGYDNKVLYRNNVPASAAWLRGDIIYDTTVTAGSFIGWVCTADGTPGTWKTFGAISA